MSSANPRHQHFASNATTSQWWLLYLQSVPSVASVDCSFVFRIALAGLPSASLPSVCSAACTRHAGRVVGAVKWVFSVDLLYVFQLARTKSRLLRCHFLVSSSRFRRGSHAGQ